MNDFQRFHIQGALINSALYIALVGAAGIYQGDHLIVGLAAATAGVGYLAYLAALFDVKAASVTGSVLSNVLGMAAGIALLTAYWG